MSKKSLINEPKFEDYEIKISQNGNEFFLKIEELSIISRSTVLEKALDKLKIKFSESISIYKDSAFDQNFPMPKKIIERNNSIQELKIFLLKFLIIGLIFFIISIFSASFIAIKVKQISVTDIIKGEVRNIYSTIEKIAPKDEESKKRQIENFRKFLHDLKPYIDEINSIQ